MGKVIVSMQREPDIESLVLVISASESVSLSVASGSLRSYRL